MRHSLQTCASLEDYASPSTMNRKQKKTNVASINIEIIIEESKVNLSEWFKSNVVISNGIILSATITYFYDAYFIN